MTSGAPRAGLARARRAAGLAGLVLAALLLAAPAAADRRADLEALREAIAASRKRVSDYEREERGLLEALESAGAHRRPARDASVERTSRLAREARRRP